MMTKAGVLMAVMGASRSGKTAYTQDRTKNEPRLVWDVKGGEYPAHLVARSHKELAHYIKTKPAAHISYLPQSLKDFNFFCKCAQAWIEILASRDNRGAVIVEETSDVTSPAKAPEEYGILLRRYLGHGSDIYAVTQRPAESEKTSVGNASQVHISRVALARDRKSVADNTGIPLEVIEKLEADPEGGAFDYIHADIGRRRYWTGKLTFKNDRPIFRDNQERYIP